MNFIRDTVKDDVIERCNEMTQCDLIAHTRRSEASITSPVSYVKHTCDWDLLTQQVNDAI
jgi:hypothetical protein